MDLAQATNSLEGAKKEVDQASLDLQNLLYEKEHLQREIQMAKELQCKELTSLQQAEGEDIGKRSESLSSWPPGCAVGVKFRRRKDERRLLPHRQRPNPIRSNPRAAQS